MAPLHVLIDPKRAQGVGAECHCGVAFRMQAIDDQRIQFGKGNTGPSLQSDHALHAVETFVGLVAKPSLVRSGFKHQRGGGVGAVDVSGALEVTRRGPVMGRDARAVSAMRQ